LLGNLLPNIKITHSYSRFQVDFLDLVVFKCMEDALTSLLSTAVAALLPACVAAGCTAAPETWQVQVKYLFDPKLPNHQAKQQERQSLDRLTGTTRETGLTLTISDGRSFLMELTIVDSGADTAILTEATCKRYGIHIFKTHVPQLLAIDGAPNTNIIGRTGPLVLTLAAGTPYAANLPLPNGALVMKGDAGGLYDLCLDKQSLHAVYGYVDPALSMLVFRPRPEQDMWLLNGIPVASAASPSRIKQLRAQGLQLKRRRRKMSPVPWSAHAPSLSVSAAAATAPMTARLARCSLARSLRSSQQSLSAARLWPSRRPQARLSAAQQHATGLLAFCQAFALCLCC
jgi:hypothetical protein